jgi:hypothetical protein
MIHTAQLLLLLLCHGRKHHVSLHAACLRIQLHQRFVVCGELLPKGKAEFRIKEGREAGVRPSFERKLLIRAAASGVVAAAAAAFETETARIRDAPFRSLMIPPQSSTRQHQH